MIARLIRMGLGALLLAFPVVAQAGPIAGSSGRAAWSWFAGSGYDSYIHSYPLATSDTTSSVAEYYALFGLEGRSAVDSRHRWHVRPEFSAGSELIRNRLEFSYQYRPAPGVTRFRLDAQGLNRLYRPNSIYSLSSNALEGWTRARFYLSPAGATRFEVRGDAAGVQYYTPSTLEVSYRDLGGGVSWRSGPAAARRFTLGARLHQRSYPDSVAIDRLVMALEGEFDAVDLGGRGLRFYHRSDRRQMRDEKTKPSAWIHWSRLDWTLPLGGPNLTGELGSEVWDYASEGPIYHDSWRLGGWFGLERGGISVPNLLLGLAAERFDAQGQPESYTQTGIRIGLETYTAAGSLNFTAEYGYRDYPFLGGDSEPSFDSALVDLSSLTYSDFHYWELWLFGTLNLTSHLVLDAMANYQPENHTERADDATVAFFSARLVFRP